MRKIIKKGLSKGNYITYNILKYVGLLMIILGLFISSFQVMGIGSLMLGIVIGLDYHIIEVFYAGLTAKSDIIRDREEESMKVHDKINDIIECYDKNIERIDNDISKMRKEYNIPDRGVEEIYESIRNFNKEIEEILKKR